MHAEAEGEVAVRCPRHIEPLRLGELIGIAVGGADAQRDRRCRRDRDAANRDACGRHAVAELVRALEAQELLHRRAYQRRIGDQPRLLARPCRQQMQAVADQVGRRLVAGIEDEDAVVQEFGLAQPLARFRARRFAGDETRQHVGLGIPRPPPPLGDQILQIGGEFLDRAIADVELRRRRRRLERPEDRQRPAAQRSALRARHAEEVADHLDRDRRREIGDDVEGLLMRDGVDEGIDQRDDSRLHDTDGARRQRAGDQSPNPAVQRRVVEHQAGRVVLVERRVAVFRPELDALVGAEARRVLVDRLDVRMAGEEIGAVRHALHRRMAPQRRVDGIGIGVEIVSERPEVEGL